MTSCSCSSSVIMARWDGASESFKVKRRLRVGTLLACIACGQSWWIDSKGKYIWKIEPNSELLVCQWAEKELVLTSTQRAELAAIRGVEVGRFYMMERMLLFPGRVETSDGQICDPALIMLATFPPIVSPSPALRFITDISRVRPSDYALSPEIRLAASRAKEISMCLAPTVIEALDGSLFTLSGMEHFFGHKSYLGKDMKLSRKRFPREKLPPIADSDVGKETWFWGDYPVSTDGLMVR